MFKLYPIQKCANCHGKVTYQMITTNDGNKTQKCSTCGWTWTSQSESCSSKLVQHNK